MGRTIAIATFATALALAACGSRERPPNVRAGSTSDAADASVDVASADVTGAVETHDGSPATGAFVALNALDDDGESLAIVRADANGRFRTPRPKVPFAVTATGASGATVFVPSEDAAKSSPLRLRLLDPAASFTITGTLSAVSGTLTNGTLIIATPTSQDPGARYRAPLSAAGAFTLHVPPGTYWLEPSSDDLLAVVAMPGGAAGERKAVHIEAHAKAPAPDPVVRWLADHALPIATTETGTPTDDIA